MMRVLIMAVGSLGDILPFAAIGVHLARRGHDVRFYGNGYFRRHVEDLGLHFTATSDAADYEAFLRSPAATDPRQGMRAVAAGVLGKVASSYRIMRDDVVPGETIVLGSTFASFATRLLRDIDRVPGAVIHLSPSLLRSEFAAPRFSPLGPMAGLPRVVKRLIWRAMDRKFMDPLYTEPFNAIRAEFGLAPVARMFHRWLHEADAALCLVPPWFAPRQPDWPAQVALTGFPLVEQGAGEPLPTEVAAFLDAGAAPLVITAGTANAVSHAFFGAALGACALLGMRAIVVTGDAGQLPAVLPDGVIHADYVPFAALLPRAAAFVHHGGIGSVSQAMRAGIPQLVQPMAFDQFDNAGRVVQLGVGREILPRRFQAERVARELTSLLADRQTAAACKALAERLREERGIGAACDALLEKLAPGAAAAPA